MGKRGYILVKADSSIISDEDKTWEWIKKAESVTDVDFASNTIGEFNFVLTVDAKDSIEKTAEDIKSLLPGIQNLIILTENNIFKKHREIKDLKIFSQIH